MLGASATSSESACRQAESCGLGGSVDFVTSAGLAVSAGAPGRCVSAAGGSGAAAGGTSDAAGVSFAAGASAGLGFGSGTAERRTALCDRCGRVPNKSSHGRLGPPRAAAAGPACMPRQSSPAAVTIAAPPRRNAPTGHFRLAFSALQFMSIP
ncbi:hypothetical protein chiPu_0032514 [Chiloscyllium punctatum]|uniref:Uncharacterized protein n=1 Tax=Chiloscyllium punctatum TaxID=137246 RepID=A0A401U065_CHIPU|nr:hypothetical protein [Chiloscyllium punctatum]